MQNKDLYKPFLFYFRLAKKKKSGCFKFLNTKRFIQSMILLQFHSRIVYCLLEEDPYFLIKEFPVFTGENLRLNFHILFKDDRRIR